MADPFALRDANEAASRQHQHVHVLKGKKAQFRCITDSTGHATPGGLSPVELVVDASEGFIPLWGTGVTLRWTFRAGTLDRFQDPAAAGAGIEQLLGEALVDWGASAPIKLTKNDDAWDFEIVVQANDDCDANGCVLASAFFPDAGRHQLYVYPILFQQTRDEQVATLCHEIGHAFGLRHFFAKVSEKDSPSKLFGKQDKFTIMNYGSFSKLTPLDKSDLLELYKEVWSGKRTKIGGTPIHQVRPYHELPGPGGAFAVAAASA